MFQESETEMSSSVETTGGTAAGATHRSRQTRAMRAAGRRRAARVRLLWGAAGIALLVCVAVVFDLLDPMAVLALVGVSEVAGRVWRRLGEWSGL